MRRFYSFWFAAIFAVFLTVGCETRNQIEPPAALSISAAPETLHYNSEPFTFTVQNHGAPAANVTWASSDQFVATVENGVFTPHHVGETTVTATVAGTSITSVVTVTPIVANDHFLEPLVNFSATEEQILAHELASNRNLILEPEYDENWEPTGEWVNPVANRRTFSNLVPRHDATLEDLQNHEILRLTEYGVSYQIDNGNFIGVGLALTVGRFPLTPPFPEEFEAIQENVDIVQHFFRERYAVIEGDTPDGREVFIYRQNGQNQDNIVIVLEADLDGRETFNELPADVYVAIYIPRATYDTPPDGLLLSSIQDLSAHMRLAFSSKVAGYLGRYTSIG